MHVNSQYAQMTMWVTLQERHKWQDTDHLPTLTIPAAVPNAKNRTHKTPRLPTNGIVTIATVNSACDMNTNQSFLGPSRSTNNPDINAPRNIPTPRAETERVISS